jgi:hypothetical protein
MARCKTCGAEIIFIKTPSGRYMPCNPAKCEYVRNDATGKATIITLTGETVRADCPPQIPQIKPNDTISDITITHIEAGYVPHWATCPTASEHRRGGGGK